MKTLILLAMISTSAMASCPNLSGVYKTCQSDSEDMRLEPFKMETTSKDGVYTYTLTTLGSGEKSIVVTDGKVTTTTEVEDSVPYIQTMKASCNDNKLIMDLTVESGDFTSETQAVVVKEGSIFSMETTSRYMGRTEVLRATCTE